MYKKNLIVGCGSEIENIYGGIHSLRNNKDSWYPLGFHQHKNSITIDIDHRSKPDIVMDFCSNDILEFRKSNPFKFELIVLENLPVSIYLNAQKFNNLAKNTILMLSTTGAVLIPRAFNTELIISKFRQFGVECTLQSIEPSLIYKQISSLTNNYADEYISNYVNNNKLIEMMTKRPSMPFLFFKKSYSLQ